MVEPFRLTDLVSNMSHICEFICTKVHLVALGEAEGCHIAQQLRLITRRRNSAWGIGASWAFPDQLVRSWDGEQWGDFCSIHPLCVSKSRTNTGSTVINVRRQSCRGVNPRSIIVLHKLDQANDFLIAKIWLDLIYSEFCWPSMMRSLGQMHMRRKLGSSSENQPCYCTKPHIIQRLPTVIPCMSLSLEYYIDNKDLFFRQELYSDETCKKHNYPDKGHLTIPSGRRTSNCVGIGDDWRVSVLSAITINLFAQAFFMIYGVLTTLKMWQ